MVANLSHGIGNPDVALAANAVASELQFAITEDPESEASPILQQATKTDKHKVRIEISGGVCQEVRQLKVREEGIRITAHGINQSLSLLDALSKGVAMGLSFLTEGFRKNGPKEGLRLRVVQQFECRLEGTRPHPSCTRFQEADLHPVRV